MMAFVARWTKTASTQYETIRADAQASVQARQRNAAPASKAEGLFKQVRDCINKLVNNPRHPGLHTHKYKSIENPYDPKQPVFEAYAQNQTPGAYRVFWCYGPAKGEITILAITPHP